MIFLQIIIIFFCAVGIVFPQGEKTILESDTYFEFMDSTETYINYYEINQCSGNEFHQYGIASFYAMKFQGRKTANGERFHQDKLTAAHKTLPFGSIVKVKSLKDNRIIFVRINDRGPFVKGRVIDLSKKGAKMLEIEGLQKVKIYSITPNKFTLPINEKFFFAFSYKHNPMCVSIDRMHILDELNDFDEAITLLNAFIETFGTNDFYLCIDTNIINRKGKNKPPISFFICKIIR